MSVRYSRGWRTLMCDAAAAAPPRSRRRPETRAPGHGPAIGMWQASIQVLLGGGEQAVQHQRPRAMPAGKADVRHHQPEPHRAHGAVGPAPSRATGAVSLAGGPTPGPDRGAAAAGSGGCFCRTPPHPIAPIGPVGAGGGLSGLSELSGWGRFGVRRVARRSDHVTAPPPPAGG